MQGQLLEQHEEFNEYQHQLADLLLMPTPPQEEEDEAGSAEVLYWDHKTNF